jgi:hypothetical protein
MLTKHFRSELFDDSDNITYRFNYLTYHVIQTKYTEYPTELDIHLQIKYDNIVKELRPKMFGQHPGYFKAVFLKQTRVIIVSIYKYTVHIMF